jgi:hypothetical protein
MVLQMFESPSCSKKSQRVEKAEDAPLPDRDKITRRTGPSAPRTGPFMMLLGDDELMLSSIAVPASVGFELPSRVESTLTPFSLTPD